MKIKVLLVRPGMEVEVKRIPASIKSIKSVIEADNILKIEINENTVILANKNAKVDDFNRIFGDIIISGTFIIVSTKNNKLISMRKRNIRRYSNIFKLKKHKNKVEHYKEEYLEDYYYNQRVMKMENAKKNSQELMKLIA